ncbi:hemagglutinin repeat-containing protein [Paraburkholderia tagetis]|uniref:Hemagglutinin repeat-containing protein n=1 Tax=Paraburkholderia tagetis TaxID=2913261 RepID=A0A9X1UHK2_9BURK|nr:hemagglutinin repeat-containing protein [Paraburkholderia tagetis]MCG5076749.1 hemagglutinin repeat-containing protein [Paraburkholderia tagetis]
MNRNLHRLVFSKTRGMLIAVEETATFAGMAAGPTRTRVRPIAHSRALFTLRQIAFAALALLGALPVLCVAQIVMGGTHAPNVIQTQNGLDQININRPSGAGVSVNTYSRFDVQSRGAILNNSPTIVQTQQAGTINGNPNFGPGQAARVIVNQVNSPAASQLNGHLEVAGQRAEVVIANPSGISVNGGGFINTSRAILTTGTPNYAADGSLSGFNVSGGNITVNGAGLNASNVDQVDLLARAVQANAAIYAKNLNIVAGANRVDHDTLAATAIAGEGPAPVVSIDVSNLGGMYANRIFLAGTELGVGVSLKGVVAANAGDLVLTTEGKLVLAGQTRASGNIGASARDGIDNSGTTYAQQSLSASTDGALANSGTLAAQQNTNVNAGSVASSGTLASGVNSDGVVTRDANLNVVSSGALSATGQNIAGGDAALTGAAVNLAGSETAANGNLALNANAGDLKLSGARTSAQGAVNAQAAGALVNDHGTVTGGSVALDAGRLSNQGGNVSAQGPLTATAAGDLSNQGGTFVSQGAMQVRGGAVANHQGTMQSAAGFALYAASLDNTAGRITSLNGDSLSLGITGTLLNGIGGVIGGNGNVQATAYTFTNLGQFSALHSAALSAANLNNAGSVTAGDALTATASGALDNTSGKLLSNTNLSVTGGALTNDGGQLGAGSNATIHAGSMTNSGGAIVAPNLAISTASTLDNTSGDIEANQLTLNAGNLVNHGGTITQYGAAPMGMNIGGTFDNSAGGTLQTNSTDFTLAPWMLNNDGGAILHAGTGLFTVAPGNGAGAFSNVGGRIVTAGQLMAQAGSLDNTSGVLAALGSINAIIAGDVNNTQGVVRSLSSVSLASGDALTNTSGQIQSGTGAEEDTSTLTVQAASIDNTAGVIGNLGTGDATVQGGSALVNSGGQITGNGKVGVSASALVNTQGGQISGANVAVRDDTLDNASGAIGNVAGSNGDVTVTATGAIDNTGGQMGATHDLAVSAATLTGGGTYSAAHDVAISMQGDFAPTPDVQFNAGHDLTFTLPGTFTNAARLEAANNLGINAGDIVNSGTMMAGGTLGTHSNTLQNTGVIVGGSVSLNATQTLSNLGPTALIGATDSDGTLELLANDIENRDDTTATGTQATTAIYGLGKVVLAGGKDANGSYTNASLIRNQSALIESAGDMALHADQVTNTRRVMTTTGFNQTVDPALLEQPGISLSGCTSVYLPACSGQQAPWNIPGDPDAIGGVYIEPPHGGQWNSGYQFTTYTGVAVANLIAGISPQAQIVAGGNLDASNVGLFQNHWSAVAAAGDIAAPTMLDQNSWQGQAAPGVQVTYSGYYHYNNYDNTEHDWTLPFGTAPFIGSRPGGYTQAAPADIRHYALPAYESSFVAGGTLSGTGISIDNTAGNAGIPSLGLAAGQSLSGVDVGALSGNADGTKSGATSVQGNASPVNPVIASATAVNVLANLTIPQGGLFTPATAPGAPYLIETNPAFTNQKAFISSDYYLQQLGLNPQTTAKRLGDGFYEQQLVRNQITSLTGKAVLGPYTDLQSVYPSLLAAGAALSQSLDLPLGMSLSSDQVARLTGNVIIMQTQIVDGQSVLVPVVYLAKTSQQNMNGPLITATDIDLRNAQTFTNSGTVQAANSLTIDGRSIDNVFGTLQSGGLMSLTTAGNVDLTSAKVSAGSLALNAGGNLILDTATRTLNQISPTGATRVTTTLGPMASLNVAGDATIVTGGNFEQHAASLNVGGNLGMAVGGNYVIGTVQTGEHKVVERANGASDTDVNSVTGSSVNVGGVSMIGVGGDLMASGASLNLGGGGTIAAKGNVTLDAAKATSTIDSNSSGSDSHGSYSESMHRADDALTATTLNAGDSLAVVSGHDINVTGSAINLDRGTATLAATGDVNIGAATETHVDNSQEQHRHSNVVSGKEVSNSRDTTTTFSQGSTISADGVSISSGNDINVKGSTVVGTNDVSLAAVHDVNITTTQNAMQSSGSHQEKESGLGTSGLTVTIGSSKMATTDQASSVTNNASAVGSLNGNLSIQAGNTLHVTGSDLVAGGNVTGMASNVIIDAATDTAQRSQTQTSHSSGLSIGLSGSVGDAINNAYAQGKAIGHSASSGNDRAAVLHAIAAGGDALFAGMGAKGLMDGASGPKAPSIGVQVSVGSSSSRSDSSESQTTNRGSNVSAGGTAAFVATGDGTPGSGNVSIAGSNVSANDVLLAARNQVNVVNTTDTDSTRSSNSSNSASAGVSFGTQGFGVSAAMSNAHGDANSDAAIQNASHVNAANSTTIISGGDTNITGSQVNGKQVIADVGGNLNISSVQDTTTSAAHQSSVGGGFSISTTGGSASVTAQKGHADGDYAQVNEQAGINAGDGGFDINVKGNTGLTGAVISSTADAKKNSLSTGTLTFSDIENHSHYSANSAGISAGAGVGNTGKATGPGSVSGSGGGIPMAQNESGDQSATTRSAISAGTIDITSQAAQTQDIASLSRDMESTNGRVDKTPDVNTILNQQADTIQAAQAAGQVVAQGIAAYANDKRDTAQKAADAAKASGDVDAYNAAMADVKSWDEGGNSRAALHVAGGALIGGLGGGNAFGAIGGAAGAGVAAWAAGDLNRLANGTRDALGGGDAAQLAGNVAANILAGGMGALVGGGAGAFAASNADLYNRSTGNGDGQGSTANSALGWIGDQLASAGRGAQNLANQFAVLVNANGPQGPYVSPDDLNGPGGNSKPPATGGSAVPVAVCVPPVCTVVPATTPGTPGYAPGNATLSSGRDDAQASNSGDSEASLPMGSKSNQFNQPKNPSYQPTRNTPGAVDRTDYAGHAFDRMQDRGLTPSVIQNTIENGVPTPSRGGTTVFYDSVNNVSVVTNSEGKVITVKYGK